MAEWTRVFDNCGRPYATLSAWLHLFPEFGRQVLFVGIAVRGHPSGHDVGVQHQDSVANSLGNLIRLVARTMHALAERERIPESLELLPQRHLRRRNELYRVGQAPLCTQDNTS